MGLKRQAVKSPDPERWARRFARESVYCFTADIDWAPEWAIESLVTFFEQRRVPLTPFLTHDSPTLRKHYGSKRRARYVGLHPNFLPNSSHGSTVDEQIDHCIRLWPDARCYRSHSFFEHGQVSQGFFNRGFRYDSNLCLFLQPLCTPLVHATGLVRFPVFWEDDTHALRRLPFSLDTLRAALARPGMKIFNVHPFGFALNMPSFDHYQKTRFLYQDASDGWRGHVHAGQGLQSMIGELLDHVAIKKKRCVYLDDLYTELTS